MSKRPDGRKNDEIRKLVIKTGVVQRADGSAYVETGGTKVVAAVYGPEPVHPRHMEKAERAILKVKYNMAPFSVKDRKRPGYDRRAIEISKVLRRALEPAIFLEDFPKAMIKINMEVLQADAGTRVAALTAAATALADAGIAMKDLVSAIAAGRANKEIIVDITKEEEDAEDAIDTPVAMMVNKGLITLLQMDGDATSKELIDIIKTAEKGCKQIAEQQTKALKEKYLG